MFWQGHAGTGEIILYDVDGELVQITDDSMHDIAPVINALGVVAWQRGEWNANYDVAMLVDDEIEMITATPDPEGGIALNDLGQLAWSKHVCYPPATVRRCSRSTVSMRLLSS